MAKELVVYNPEDFWAFYQTGGTYESIYIQLSRQGLLRGEGRGKQSGIGIGQGSSAICWSISLGHTRTAITDRGLRSCIRRCTDT